MWKSEINHSSVFLVDRMSSRALNFTPFSTGRMLWTLTITLKTLKPMIPENRSNFVWDKSIDTGIVLGIVSKTDVKWLVILHFASAIYHIFLCYPFISYSKSYLCIIPKCFWVGWTLYHLTTPPPPHLQTEPNRTSDKTQNKNVHKIVIVKLHFKFPQTRNTQKTHIWKSGSQNGRRKLLYLYKINCKFNWRERLLRILLMDVWITEM